MIPMASRRLALSFAAIAGMDTASLLWLAAQSECELTCIGLHDQHKAHREGLQRVAGSLQLKADIRIVHVMVPGDV